MLDFWFVKTSQNEHEQPVGFWVCAYTPHKVLHVAVFNSIEGYAYSYHLHLKLNLQNTEMMYCIHLPHLIFF